MKVLVTGSGGKLGGSIMRELDATVGVAALGTRRARTSPYFLDLTDSDSIDALLERHRPDVVVHLAGMPPPDCQADEELARRVNVQGTRELMEASTRWGATRLVFASSAAVYGVGTPRRLEEDGPLRGDSVYAKTKIGAEEALRSLSGRSTSVTILRIFNAWGPSFPDSLIARLSRATAPHPVALFGWDDFVRDYVHESDVAHAVRIAATREPADEFTTVNVGSGDAISNRRLTERLGVSHDNFIVTAHQRSYSCADTSRAAEQLGFSAMVTVTAIDSDRTAEENRTSDQAGR